jgi:hypothetical protein
MFRQFQICAISVGAVGRAAAAYLCGQAATAVAMLSPWQRWSRICAVGPADAVWFVLEQDINDAKELPSLE